MSSVRAARDFDTLAPVYDETRQPLDPSAVQKLLDFLGEHEWKSILEVGVGTGRVSQPLAASGLHLVGVDASRGMLAVAATKRLRNLVHGTAYHLPFPDRAFDVALFVHVLHILDDPSAGLSEAARVSRSGALAIMDGGPDNPTSEEPREPTPRDLVREVLANEGYPNLLRGGPRAKEREILKAHPPTETRLLCDREVTEPLSKQLDTIAKRGYRHVLDVPPEVLDKAVRSARARIGDRTVTYRRREMVVWWSRTSP